MRILPSQSTVMNRNVGSTDFVHDGQIEAVALGNQRPIIDARAAEWVDAQRDLGIANRRHIDDVFEIAHIGVQVVIFMRRRSAASACANEHSLDALRACSREIRWPSIRSRRLRANQPARRAEDRT